MYSDYMDLGLIDIKMSKRATIKMMLEMKDTTKDKLTYMVGEQAERRSCHCSRAYSEKMNGVYVCVCVCVCVCVFVFVFGTMVHSNHPIRLLNSW